MGASSFTEISKGKTAQEAFKNAVDEALYMYGQEPYSGTIKEKGSFREITVPPTWKKSAEDYAYKCMDDGICMEKWGPAGCIRIKSEAHMQEVPYKATIQKIINTETRKWETVYVVSFRDDETMGGFLSQSEKRLEFKKQGEAELAAKALAVKQNRIVTIDIEKKLTNAPKRIAVVTPVTKTVKIPNGMNTYIFFGLASS